MPSLRAVGPLDFHEVFVSAGWTRLCTSEGCGTGFEGIDELQILRLLRNILPWFSHALVWLSDEKDMDSLNTPLVLEFPVTRLVILFDLHRAVQSRHGSIFPSDGPEDEVVSNETSLWPRKNAWAQLCYNNGIC
ncbi:hypothetical protein BS47DRAFT_1357805 [Hydnum rufescens UP504]|uniref:Uncharacterized protein n=1 Tax=Hydnum rufescens UP504 TaxID=1448309 RepID=A0A9P6DZ18_9AGAM|nr:hypothetical protein BS47DRAFT_1357805 [Hydnum rufescens UP504]